MRRGLGDPAAARRFLAAEEAHPLEAFGGLRDAAGRDPRPRRRGARGSPSTATTTSTASPRPRSSCARCARSGADVDWYLPSRIDDGYGLAASTVERLAARGTDLLVTVDCAITAVDEVAAARAAGMDVVVTDHHAPRADGALPDAPIVHPRLGGYPCPDLCAAGVAYKLAQALLAGAGEDPAAADEDLDLVALATVADVVSLHGREPAARARRPAPARRHAQAGPAGADGRRARRPERASTRARSASASPRGSTPPAGSTAPTPGSSCCSPSDRERARADRGRARRGQRRAPRRRDAHPLRGRGAAGRAERARRARARARRRGLAPGRDRDRRRAHRRAPPPPDRADRARRRPRAPAPAARSRASTCSPA